MLVSTKARISFLLNSPLTILSGFGQNLLYKFRVPAQVERMRKLTRKTPLFLQIETINTCNASCIFCAYPAMKRKKGIMSLPLFEKIAREYAGMGGGSVNLTPIMGDALLDPHLMKRLEILKKNPAIKQVTVTTNGIALKRYSDQAIRSLLQHLSRIQVSIGGLDAVTYKTMYSVDRFSEVNQGMERLLALRESVADPARISFAFRTNDRKFETRYKARLDAYRAQGVKISHMCVFANFSGAIQEDKEKGLAVYPSRSRQRLACVYPCMNMVVCWNGTITACCDDYNADELKIGSLEQQTLAEVWAGKKRAELVDSFEKDNPPPVCRKCSGYLPDTVFANPCFKGFQPHQPLPEDFFLF